MLSLFCIRSVISSADFFVNEIKRISFGFIFFTSQRYFTFAEIVSVFPLPAPARTKILFSSVITAVRCCSSNDLPSIFENNDSYFVDSF